MFAILSVKRNFNGFSPRHAKASKCVPIRSIQRILMCLARGVNIFRKRVTGLRETIQYTD